MKWWLSRLIGRPNNASVDWPYPFAEGKLFVLTVTAGLEGYHVNVDGRHVASFPYRTGYSLEDATGLSLNGDLDIESIFAGYLPSSHPSFAPQRYLEMSEQWKASPLPTEPVELFIGILSAANHFAERMAVRKSWMIATRKTSNIVARFFVALVRVIPAKHIMKCDDDTFVRIDSVLDQVKKVQSGGSMYMGNINYYHRPLRSGKWAVTYEIMCISTMGHADWKPLQFLCFAYKHCLDRSLNEMFFFNLSVALSFAQLRNHLTFHFQGYSWEVTTAEGGQGLNELLSSRKSVLNGIVNGIDISDWNPATDKHLPCHYSVNDLSGKAKCKAELQKELGLPIRPDVPLIGFIGRLDYQKGIDLIKLAIPDLMQEDIQFENTYDCKEED